MATILHIIRIIRDYPPDYQVYTQHFVSPVRNQFGIEWDEFVANLIELGGTKPLRADWNERLLIFLKLALPLAQTASMSTSLFKHLLFVLAQGRRVSLSRNIKPPTSRTGVWANCCSMVMDVALFMFHHILVHDSLRDPDIKCTECPRGTRYRPAMICKDCLNKNGIRMTPGQLLANQQMYEFYHQIRRYRVFGTLKVCPQEGPTEGSGVQEDVQGGGAPQEGDVPQEGAQEGDKAQEDEGEHDADACPQGGEQDADVCPQEGEQDADVCPQDAEVCEQEVVPQDAEVCEQDAEVCPQEGAQEVVPQEGGQDAEVCEQEVVPPTRAPSLLLVTKNINEDIQ